MRKAALVLLIVPLLFAAGSIISTSSQGTAYAATRVGGGPVGGRAFVGGGGGSHGGGGGYHGGGGGYYGRGGYYGGYRGGYYGGHGGHGGHDTHVGVWFGGPWFWDPFYYPFYPYYAYPYYPPSRTVVIPQQPEQYIQAPQQEENYWYYCKDKGATGYYPYVKRCPGGWMRVVPTPAPPEQEPD